jgi:hypothetical protein
VVAVTALNVPQEPAGVQLKTTPAFAESFETVTAIFAVKPSPIDAGGGVEKVTEMAGGGLELPPPQAMRMKDREARMNRGASIRFMASPGLIEDSRMNFTNTLR